MISLHGLLFLVFFGAVFGIDQNIKPRAVIHVGPPKTGSTHLQKKLLLYKDQLANQSYHLFGSCDYSHNFLYLYLNRNHPLSLAKTLSNAPIECKENKTSIENFFKLHKSNQENILISSEHLFSNIFALKRLIKILHGYEIIIFIVYRQFFNMELSDFNEINKFTEYWKFRTDNPVPFFSERPKYDINDFFHHLEMITTLIGEYNVIVVDYYGVNSRGLDMTYVLMCEGLKINCIKRENFYINSTNPLIENKSKDLTSMQMLNILTEYAKKKKCRVVKKRVEQFFQYKWNLIPPMVKINITNEISESLYFDEKLRNQTDLYYGNYTANINALKELKYTEINKKFILNSQKWNKQLEKAFKKFKETKMIKCPY